MSMLKYAIRRILVALPVLFGVLTMGFIFSRMMPGDPVRAQLDLQNIGRPNEIQYAQMEHLLGLDLPILVQYFRYLGQLFSGNWGVSVSVARNEPVWDLITTRLPRTIDLTIFSMIIASYIGIKIGVVSATHRNKMRDTIFRGMSLLGVAIPIFFLGMLLQYTLAYVNPIFPATLYKNADYADPAQVTGFYIIDSLIAGELYKITDYLYHYILPVFCLSLVPIADIV